MGRTQEQATWYMVTVIGRDRPGIVAALTESLFLSHCQLGETSMARLGGNFTIMMMVCGAVDELDLAASLDAVAKEWDLRIHVDVIDAALHLHLDPDVQISIYGADRTGILADATRTLAAAGLTILDMHSTVAGTFDQPVYIMIIEGLAQQGLEPLEQALTQLHLQGMEARLSPIDTMVG